MTVPAYRGIYTALITPFHADGSIDFNAYTNLIERQIESGVHGLVPCGTTGETPTLSDEEQIQVIQACIRAADGRVPVIAGGSRNATRSACDFHRQLAELGANASLQCTPWYNKPTQEGLYRHFRAIAESAPLDIILYNVPSRTGVDLSAETVLRLARDCKNIVGIKEASGVVARSQEILAGLTKFRDDFSVLSGEDTFILPLLGMGGHGVISVISHMAAGEMVEMFDAHCAGNASRAQEISARLSTLVPLMFSHSNPIPVKTALAWQSDVTENFRLPLCPLADEDRDVLIKALQQTQWIKDV